MTTHLNADHSVFEAEVLGSPLQHFVGTAVGLRQRLQLAALAHVYQFGGCQGRVRGLV